MISLFLTPDPAQLSAQTVSIATGDALLSADAFTAVLIGGDNAAADNTLPPKTPRDAPLPDTDAQVELPAAQFVAPIEQPDLPATPILLSPAPNLPDPSWPETVTTNPDTLVPESLPLRHHDIARVPRHTALHEAPAPLPTQPDASTPTPLIQWALFAKDEALKPPADAVPQADKTADDLDPPAPILPGLAAAAPLPPAAIHPAPAVEALAESQPQRSPEPGLTQSPPHPSPAQPTTSAQLQTPLAVTPTADTLPEPPLVDHNANIPAPPAMEDLPELALKQVTASTDPRSAPAHQAPMTKESAPVAETAGPLPAPYLGADKVRSVAPEPETLQTISSSYPDEVARAPAAIPTIETWKPQAQILAMPPIAKTAPPMPAQGQQDVNQAPIATSGIDPLPTDPTPPSNPFLQSKAPTDLPVSPIQTFGNHPVPTPENVIAAQVTLHFYAAQVRALDTPSPLPPGDLQQHTAVQIKVGASVSKVVLPKSDNGADDTIPLPSPPAKASPQLTGQAPVTLSYLRYSQPPNAPPQPPFQPYGDLAPIAEPAPEQGAAAPLQAITVATPSATPTAPNAVNQRFVQPDPPKIPPLAPAFPAPQSSHDVTLADHPSTPAMAPASLLIKQGPTEGQPNESAAQQPSPNRLAAAFSQPPTETRPTKSRESNAPHPDAPIVPVAAVKPRAAAENAAVQAPPMTQTAAVIQTSEPPKPAEPHINSTPTLQPEQAVTPAAKQNRPSFIPLPAIEGIGRHRVEPTRLPVLHIHPSSQLKAPPAIPESASLPLTSPKPPLQVKVTLPAAPGLDLTPPDKVHAPQSTRPVSIPQPPPATVQAAPTQPVRIVHADDHPAKLPKSGRKDALVLPPTDAPTATRQSQGLTPSAHSNPPVPVDHVTPALVAQSAPTKLHAATPTQPEKPSARTGPATWIKPAPDRAKPVSLPVSNSPPYHWTPQSAVPTKGAPLKATANTPIPPNAKKAPRWPDQSAAERAPTDSIKVVTPRSNKNTSPPERQHTTPQPQSDGPMAALPATPAATTAITPIAAPLDRQRKADAPHVASTDQPTMTPAAPPSTTPPPPAAQSAFTVAAQPREARRLPHGLAPQVARAASRAPRESQVELTLDPVELGKLRFEIITTNDRTQINLSVERTDTLDLLRRHADILRAEFREAGFDGASLNFSQWTRQGNEHSTGQNLMQEFEADDQTPSRPDAVPQRNSNSAGQGLDLRL